jgi:hypothetical protein
VTPEIQESLVEIWAELFVETLRANSRDGVRDEGRHVPKEDSSHNTEVEGDRT